MTYNIVDEMHVVILKNDECIMMKMKKIAGILFAAAVSVACFSVTVPVLTTAYAAETAIQTTVTFETITLNSAEGKTAQDIQAALVSLKGVGGMLTLVGEFNLTETLKIYSNETNASINGTVDLILNLYQAEKITIRGGNRKISSNSQFAKISTCSSGKIQNQNVSGGKLHAINITKSQGANISENTISSPQQNGIYVNSSSNAVISKNTISNCKKYGIQIMNGSKSAKLTNNTITNPAKQGIQIENSTGCNVKTMTTTTLSSLSTKSTKASGKITKGNTAKIKIGSKYYACTVKGTAYTSNNFPKQKKYTIVYLYDYVGSGNVVRLSTKVK